MEPAGAAAAEELRALVERVGGRQRLLLVAERRAGEPPPRALLEGFARDLLGEPGGGGGGGGAGGAPERGGGPGRRWPRCPLAFVLCRPGAAGQRSLREVVRDVRGRLPAAAALVGVLVREGAAPEPDEAARLRLEALLRRVCAPRRPALHDALQAAHYSPAGPPGAADVRAAACRALRAVLQLRADGVETEKQRLPAFLRCFPWGRRTQKLTDCLDKPADNCVDDGLQEAEEGVALTDMAPNGNREDVCGVAGT